MFCPKCSHEQVSDEIRFCSKCGFQLDAVRSVILLEGTGKIAQTAEDAIQSARKKYTIIGASIMFVFALAVALFTVSLQAPTPLGAVVIPLVLFWLILDLGVLLSKHTRNEIARLFSKEDKGPAAVDGKSTAQALPEGYSAPVASSWMSRTGELEPVASVTERTTNLLDKKDAR